MTEPNRIEAIHHLQITIPSGPDHESSARAFYCGVLGLDEIEKPGVLRSRGGFWLRVGDRQLHLGVEDGVDRHATKAHVAFEVTALDAWRRRLSATGCDVLESIQIPGCARFEVRDPFGNRLEFIEVQAEAIDRDSTG